MTYYSHCKLKTMSYLRSLLMFYSLRHLAPESKFCHALHLDVFEQMIPAALIREVLTETQGWEERERRLNMATVIAIIIAMSLLPCLSIPHVLQTIAQGLRYIWCDPTLRCLEAVPSASGAVSWACCPCAACSSGSAAHVRPYRRQERLPSACY
jgi:hypothetical protein